MYPTMQRTALSFRNQFEFKHAKLSEKDTLSCLGACVLFATPGMLQAGMALEAFKQWAADPCNLVLLPGHCVEGTVGRRLLHGDRSVTIDTCGSEISVECAVEQASISAHADARGILSAIRTVSPMSVVLVHGERVKMAFLKRRVTSLFGLPCFDPANGARLGIATVSKVPILVAALVQKRALWPPAIPRAANTWNGSAPGGRRSVKRRKLRPNVQARDPACVTAILTVTPAKALEERDLADVQQSAADPSAQFPGVPCSSAAADNVRLRSLLVRGVFDNRRMASAYGCDHHKSHPACDGVASSCGIAFVGLLVLRPIAASPHLGTTARVAKAGLSSRLQFTLTLHGHGGAPVRATPFEHS